MSKKYGLIKPTTGIFIILLTFLVIGGLWMSTKQEAPFIEETEDEVSNLLENLEQETGIDFSDIVDVEFDWMVEKNNNMERVAIQGKGFEANEISIEQYSEVESFLRDNGFVADIYNAAAGTISGLDGYRKDYLVCVVIGGASGYKEAEGQWIPPEINKRDVEVRCGQSDESIDAVISKTDAIKKLLADKYGKKVAEVTISIGQETDNNVRGGVEFQPGGPGNAGIFLAAKVDGSWQIVFDGQGVISCEDMADYNFPEEMITDCSNTRNIETKKDENFLISLEANATTGYQWEVDFDSDYLQLVDKDYRVSSPELIGSGGYETFKFQALKSGQTEITFSYLRIWESRQPAKTKVYQITIK